MNCQENFGSFIDIIERKAEERIINENNSV